MPRNRFQHKDNKSVHAHLFSRDRKSPIRYNKDKDDLSADKRRQIEEIKQQKHVPLNTEELDLNDDPFFN